MSQFALLRWPDGSGWGHVSVRTEHSGLPRFVGFVRIDDPRVQELLDRTGPPIAEGDMLEVEFPVSELMLTR